MRLKILGSSSSGNGYILENDSEALVIEAGVPVEQVKKAMGYNIAKIVGCVVSHEHGDHAGHAMKYMKAGIDIYASAGTIEAKALYGHRSTEMLAGTLYRIGRFTVMGFDVEHDCSEPLGFLIHHPDCGNVLFATDTYYLQYTFRDLNNILIEANFSREILDANVSENKLNHAMRNRVMQSHMDIDTTKEVLQANDLTQVNNIVLIHLSAGNSNAEQFMKEVKELTGKTVYVADRGMEIEFNKTAI